MIYVAAVKIKRSASPLLLQMPTPERALSESGLLENHDYIPLGEIDLEEADVTIREEANLLRRIEAIPESMQCSALQEIDDELYEEFGPFGTFDTGVTGLIQALSAIGCVTITSCNGGILKDTKHGMKYPCVVFHAPVSTFGLLLEGAEKVDAGLVNTDNGMLELYADDIWKLNRLASFIVEEFPRLSLIQARNIGEGPDGELSVSRNRHMA